MPQETHKNITQKHTRNLAGTNETSFIKSAYQAFYVLK